MTTRKTGPVCAKCATVKRSGKRSCCAPGGAWFNKCGNTDNKDVDYSWVEGIRACNTYAVSFSGNEQSQLMLNHDAMRDRSNATRGQNGTKQDVVNVGGVGGESETVDTDCECLDEFTKTMSWISFSFIILAVC